MKKILWVSKYKPLESQTKELRRLFGDDVVIDEYRNPLSSASQVSSFYKRGYYDEMVLIAPLSICRVLCEYGYHPLYSVMQQVPQGEEEIKVRSSKEVIMGNPRYYKFVEFKRIERLELVLSNLNT